MPGSANFAAAHLELISPQASLKSYFSDVLPSFRVRRAILSNDGSETVIGFADGTVVACFTTVAENLFNEAVRAENS